jgi:hypothetical protein
MNNNQDYNALRNVLQDSDSWLMKYGMITPQKHNAVIIDLYAVFPRIKLLEYYVDPDNRRLELILYLSFWRLFLMFITFRTGHFLRNVLQRLEEHFEGYAVNIKLRRLSKAKEQRHEEPVDVERRPSIDDQLESTKLQELQKLSDADDSGVYVEALATEVERLSEEAEKIKQELADSSEEA